MDLILKEVKKIVCENLKIEEINPKESLYQKGIDSMNMLFVLNEIENCFNIKIPDEELLMSNFETIEQICKLIVSLRENTYEPT
jgi:acyl carrier protein